MENFLELQQAVQSDLTIGSESTFFTPDTVKLAINRSYIKCAGLFRWPETEDAKKTSTVANQEVYDYPDNWRSDSMWKLIVDGVDYGDPVSFRDYEKDKEDEVLLSSEHMWSTFGRRFFIHHALTNNGEDNITVWGQRIVDKLIDDGDATIFSYSLPEGNEAVVLEAVAILKKKGESERSGQLYSNEAKELLATAWGKIRQDQTKYEKTRPFFEVPDFFSGRFTRDSRNRIGNF